VGALIAAGYPSGYEDEAYRTVSGQNSNNSIRIPNEFFEKLDNDEDWELKGRMDGRVMKKFRLVNFGIKLPMQHGAVRIPVLSIILL
jgi:hypothetical protein